MSRIFFSLALFAIALLIATMLLGLRIGDYNAPYQRVLELQRALKNGPSDVESDVERRRSIESEIDDLYEQLEPMRDRSSTHKLISIMAAIVTILVNSIAVTYFIGTSRWCKEVAIAYSLDESFPRKSTAIKRRSFPWSFLGILTTLGIIALGAASDPATLLPDTAKWVEPHLWAAFIGVTVIAISFFVQMINIRTHTDLVEEMLGKVREIRLEKGLDVE